MRDVKKQVELIEKQRQELEEYKRIIMCDIHLAKAGVANAFGVLAVVEKNSSLGYASRVCSIVCDDLQNIKGEILLTRYQNLYQETLCWLERGDYIDLLVSTIENLKYIEIPKTIAQYDEIMKIHFDILDKINQAIVRRNN